MWTTKRLAFSLHNIDKRMVKEKIMKGIFTLICLAIASTIFSQGYDIKVTIEGYSEPDLYLANNYGDKQYVKDTVAADADGSFRFKGNEPLEPGIYLIVLAPDNNIFQLMIDKDDQTFEVSTTNSDPSNNVKIKGNKLNEDFYNYLNFLSAQRPKAMGIQERIKAAQDAGNETEAEKISEELEMINLGVREYQDKVLNTQSASLLSAIIKSSFQLEIPDFLDSENPEFDRYLYAKAHWFDNLDMADPRFLRSPIQFEKVNYYIEKLTPQRPDSLIESIEHILSLVKPAEETFKFYVTYFLNTYAKSKIIGFDAIYVHLGEKYYATDQTPWIDEEQRKKIIENVFTLKPLLIGKIAPDLKLMEIDIDKTIELKDNEDEHKRFAKKREFNLIDIKAPYTVLFIWDPDCGHCKKSMPEIIAFHEKWNPRGVELVALCTEVYKDIPKCAEMIKEKGMVKFLNAMDPYIQSKYKTIYDVRTTPQIYVLDSNKEIIMKRIDAKQLDEVFEELMLNDELLKEKLK